MHRIGRTGRAGKEGEAISFCSPEERFELKAIEKALKMKLPEGDSSILEKILAALPKESKPENYQQRKSKKKEIQIPKSTRNTQKRKYGKLS
jgi:ATP-dependent RNA helicase RhlE